MASAAQFFQFRGDQLAARMVQDLHVGLSRVVLHESPPNGMGYPGVSDDLLNTIAAAERGLTFRKQAQKDCSGFS